MVTAYVDHRINIASSYQEVQQHLIDTILPLAKEYNLELEAFGEKTYQGNQCPMHINDPKAGKIIITEAFNSSYITMPSTFFYLLLVRLVLEADRSR